MAAFDPFASHQADLTAVATHAVDVVPSDTVDLAVIPRALWLGTGGDLRVTMKGGEVVTFKNSEPTWFDIRVTRIWATGTTAADLVAVW